jgi:ubiquinone/menaquinone biosynthesis C-methylase UbiE
MEVTIVRPQAPELDRYKASSLRAYNEKLPGRYDSAIAFRIFKPSTMDDFVLHVLGEGLRDRVILDVGCATGRLLERLAAAGARKLAGADLAPRILDEVRRKLARFDLDLELKSADAESRLPWPDGTFDVVAATGVIHHFCAPGAALGEMQRVLRPNGVLVIVDACFFSPLREFFNLCLRVHPHEGDCRFRARKQLRQLLVSCGWEVNRCERINWWAFGAVARRIEEGLSSNPGPKRLKRL